MKKRFKVLLALSVAILISVILPMALSAQMYTDIEGVYMFRLPRYTADLSGTRYELPYRYVAIELYQDSEEVYGYTYFLERDNIRGSTVLSGTATVDGRRGRHVLEYDDNTVNIIGTGTITVRLPDGCEGYVMNGDTGVIDGGARHLESGDHTLTITTQGDITVYAWISYQDAGYSVGYVGAGTSPSILLTGPDKIVRVYDSGTAVITGPFKYGDPVEDYWRVYEPGTMFEVTTGGTFTMQVPQGTFGSIVGSGGLLFDGESTVVIDSSGWYDVTTNSTTGYLHVNTYSTQNFVLNGFVRSRSGEVSRITGRMEGTVMLTYSPTNFAVLSSRVRAVPTWWYPLT